MEAALDAVKMTEQSEKVSDDLYFDCYANLSLHRTMLKDKVRTLTYRKAILTNKHLFKGRVVLDIGCGTSILSMFAAQAGAALVIGIDNSNIIDHAKQIVKDNKLDHVITLVKGKLEELDELPYGIEKVDIIISEWMGYCLHNEWMLETVLHAKEKWLKPLGLIFPDKFSLILTAVEDYSIKYNGKALAKQFPEFYFPRSEEVDEPVLKVLGAKNVVGTEYELMEFDLNTLFKEELFFKQDYSIEISRKSTVHALLAYFTVTFSCCHGPTVGFSTGPQHPATHWKQTLFYFQKPIDAEKGKLISGEFVMQKYLPWPRGVEFFVTANYGSEEEIEYQEDRYFVLS